MTYNSSASKAAMIRCGLAYMRKYGWTQGVAKDDNEAVCLIGAMGVGEQSFLGSDQACLVDIYFTIRELFPDYLSLIDFNDAKGRTQEEVELVMEKTAIKLEEMA